MLAKLRSTAGATSIGKPLPLTQAIALHDAMHTVLNVIAGFRCQPRFNKDNGYCRDNEAGEELEDLAETIGGRMGELVELVRASRPTERVFREHRMTFLLRHEIGNDDAIADVASAAVRAVFQDQF
jgi:hypothetical protein